MAAKKGLVIVSGRTSQIDDADTLLTGVGLDAATEAALAIGATNATSLALGAAGIVTTVNGELVIPSGAGPTLDAVGKIAIDTTIADHTGAIKFHDGAEEITVVGMPTANLTAVDGHTVQYDAANNEFKMADSSSPVTADSLDTTTNTLATGEACYVSANGVVNQTDADVWASSQMLGVYNGTASSVVLAGVIDAALFTTDGGAPSPGDVCFLAGGTADTSTGAGKFTATAPSTGHLAPSCIVIDHSNYAGSKTCKVALVRQLVVVL